MLWDSATGIAEFTRKKGSDGGKQRLANPEKASERRYQVSRTLEDK